MKFFFHGAMKKKKKKKKNSANQNSPICMKTTDIKLFGYNRYITVFIFHGAVLCTEMGILL